jgi:hypothetical protein
MTTSLLKKYKNKKSKEKTLKQKSRRRRERGRIGKTRKNCKKKWWQG